MDRKKKLKQLLTDMIVALDQDRLQMLGMYNVELHTKIETYLRKYEQENKPKKNEK